ncbi:preprotein translocase subunit YajC [Apilactobacillus xinyiensis]|uniref:Preprotein translocase subunit YajC n=1 Tax=Apilactobacillus xinyiensis TaxID=2841032 RepID=A0ABT0I1S0_9LACO|nr:preprotein translocase subunit YajC [Apilactobacillus xinyiensis]MCK8624675.1 preprotein translocase subunit YajC [Apilactobacillus xinyiensis]MCL0312342.1 preprotein translocase subunit YajC [Apilactobacillus xinyiensis]MCL0318790.1 preprotein translocase subunit YajC [Apilactobacillus xinyiensis]MCL0329968.1 preprotein translocase subunit YajC [Apilactobacillus xinyiensis]
MNYMSLAFIVVLFALMYFMMIRPQKKQQQKHAETLRQLKKGDHVVTIGRLHGVVDAIDQDKKTVSLDCDGIFLTFDLNAIASVSQQSPAEVASESDKKDEETSSK